MLLLVLTMLAARRSRRERALEAAVAAERAREMDDKVAELTRIQSEMTGRMQTIAEVFGSRQSDFARHDLRADRRACSTGSGRGSRPRPGTRARTCRSSTSGSR